MADPESPVEDTNITTTAVTSKRRVRTELRYDSTYVRKKDGIFKIFQILVSFLAFVSTQCSLLSPYPTPKFFSFVSMLGVWVTGILLFSYLFHFVEKCTKIPWIKFEFFYCAILAVMFLTTSFMMAAYQNTAFQAAAFFGFLAAIAYAFDTFFKYGAMKSGRPPQGEQQTNKDTTIAITPDQ